jgi:hypothetical protein
MIRTETESRDARREGAADLFERLAELGFDKQSRFGTLIWAGAYQGRGTTLTISRQSRTRYQGETRRRHHLGWRLRIEMDCGVMTRLFFVKGSVTQWRLLRWLYRLKKQFVIEDLPEVLDGFHVIARDAIWARNLLKDRAAMLRVASLLTERSTERLRGSIYFQPERLHYGSGLLQPGDIDAAWVESILQRATQIADSAERLPGPMIQDHTTRLEQLSRNQPLLAAGLILSILLGGLIVVTCVGLGLFLALAWGLSSLS